MSAYVSLAMKSAYRFAIGVSFIFFGTSKTVLLFAFVSHIFKHWLNLFVDISLLFCPFQVGVSFVR